VIGGLAQEGDTPSAEIDGNAIAARDQHRAPYVKALQDRLLPLAVTSGKSVDHRPIARVHVSREVPKKYQRHSRKQENSTAPRTPPACRALHRRGRLYSRRTRRKVHAVQRSNKIVYNLAQTGTGPARKALIPTFCNLHHLPFSNSHGHVVALLAPQVPRDVYTSHHGLPVARTWFFLQSGEWPRSERPPMASK
jgi:hypothetical protein